MTTASLDEVQRIVRIMATTAVANEKYFGDLDAVVGDGDFGYSLARGFEAVLEAWDSLDRTGSAPFLRSVAMVITGRMGGTSGPIWGTAFLRAAAAAANKEKLVGAEAVEMLRASIEGIKARGNADLGDKTLLDSLIPAVDVLHAEVSAGSSSTIALQKMADTARACAESSRELTARRGRSSYAGERSVGALDPGAVAIAVMLARIVDEWQVQRDQTETAGGNE